MEVSSVDDDAGQQECGAAQATLPAEFGEGAGSSVSIETRGRTRLGAACRISPERGACERWPRGHRRARRNGNENACTTRSQNRRVVLPDHRQDPRRQELRLFGTAGATGPFEAFARTKLGAQEAEQRAIRDALATMSVATPTVATLIAAAAAPTATASGTR